MRTKIATQYKLKNRSFERGLFTLPGTFLNILGQGVFIKGQSGSGKSTLSLELVNRGHQLIADDAVWFEKKQQKILGKCPPLIQDFMYVKEFGIINVRKMFGANAICLYTELKLVIQLSSTKKNERHIPKVFQATARRARGRAAQCTQTYMSSEASAQHSCSLKDEGYTTTSILGVGIPTITMSARSAPAILVETAVRDLLLKAQGYVACEEFNHQHQQFMHHQTKNYDS